MYKLRTGVVGLVTVLILCPSAAVAKNYCVSGFFNAAYILVGQDFTVPAKGKCKAWIGFNPESGNWATAGIGCTSG